MFNKSETLKKSNCNGILIETERCWDKNDEWFTVTIVDQYDDWSEPEVFDGYTREEALAAHDKFVKEYKDKPNWNAQATYDEAYGTINGEDAGIVEMRELWGC